MSPVRDLDLVGAKRDISHGMNPALSSMRKNILRKCGVVAIVPAAGCGKRLGSKVRKPFVTLGGRPLVVHALKTLAACASIDAIIVAAEASQVRSFEKLVGKYRIGKVAAIVAGGRTRYDSVKNCLARIGPSFDIVVIHDGARPLVEKKTIAGAIRLARAHGGCIVAVPESDTIKLVDKAMYIQKTLDRSRIFRAQTPQVFRTGLIKKAYALKGDTATDDASLVEAAGGRVKILAGPYRNIKVTTKEDLLLAEVLL